MANKQKVIDFLHNNKFEQINCNKFVKDLLEDMKNGLSAKSLSDPSIADEPMLVASSKIPHSLPSNSSTIVIDAGGTNFRSCLVTIKEAGQIEISHLQKTSMPATKTELSKKEFYDAIAQNLEHLKNLSTNIGFCFSYAMEITPDNDGKVLKFSKEIKAPEVIGTLVGHELKLALKDHGWNDINKIILLNDTMASLLSGIIYSNGKKEYSSYIGFILGTGLNNAYIENEPIEKLLPSDSSSEHIIVCEGGMYGKLPQSNFDVSVDKNSTGPGTSKLEKMCSGAYLGPIAYYAIKQACEEQLFSSQFSHTFKQLDNVMAVDIDEFLNNPNDSFTKLGSLINNSDDCEILEYILETIIKRTADIVACILTASILKSGKGKQKELPICIVGNGSTFWKAHGLFDSIKEKMNELLTDDWLRYYEIIKIDNDIVLGTSTAAFI